MPQKYSTPEPVSDSIERKFWPMASVLIKSIIPLGHDDGCYQYDDPPMPVFLPDPTYPLSCKRDTVFGVSYVLALVDSTGIIIKTEIGKSSGDERLDKVSLSAARKGRFVPMSCNDKKIETWVSIPYRFLIFSRGELPSMEQEIYYGYPNIIFFLIP
jgi:TonB family protein